MARGLGLFAIGLVFGGGLGFVVAAGNGIAFDGHDHSDPSAHADMDRSSGDHAMAHDTLLEVPAVDAPEVTLSLTPDPMTGYNMQVRTRNFSFAPQDASLADRPGEGHAHVYVNGTKIARLYGEWMHIDRLPEGEVTIEVVLNSNDHRPLAVAGQKISAQTRLIVE